MVQGPVILKDVLKALEDVTPVVKTNRSSDVKSVLNQQPTLGVAPWMYTLRPKILEVTSSRIIHPLPSCAPARPKTVEPIESST